MLFRPPLIEINRAAFTLTFWNLVARRYLPKFVYSIAVGMVGHETPTGLYFIEGKTRTPDWKAPDSDWVLPPEKRGKVFTFKDPENPFAGGFMSVSHWDGIGIHGTKFPPRLGEDVSHGCIRMSTPDFLELYKKTAIGVPVFIH